MTLCYSIQRDSATCFESFYHVEYYNSLFASKTVFFSIFFVPYSRILHFSLLHKYIIILFIRMNLYINVVDVF